jgi:4-oxalocrotonate tautomerase
MPVLQLKVTPLANPDRYRSLAAALTSITAHVLRKRPEVTAVIVEDLPAAQWFISGESASQPTAFLEISVTAGTNTPEEKSAFIAAAHAELQRQLAPGGTLAPASYVIVREWPACDWGYEGRTQAARRVAVAPA